MSDERVWVQGDRERDTLPSHASHRSTPPGRAFREARRAPSGASRRCPQRGRHEPDCVHVGCIGDRERDTLPSHERDPATRGTEHLDCRDRPRLGRHLLRASDAAPPSVSHPKREATEICATPLRGRVEPKGQQKKWRPRANLRPDPPPRGRPISRAAEAASSPRSPRHLQPTTFSSPRHSHLARILPHRLSHPAPGGASCATTTTAPQGDRNHRLRRDSAADPAGGHLLFFGLVTGRALSPRRHRAPRGPRR